MASLPPTFCRAQLRLSWRSSVRGGCAERSVPSSAGSASSSRGFSSSSPYPSSSLPAIHRSGFRRGGRRWRRSARSGAVRSLGARSRQLETHRHQASPAGSVDHLRVGGRYCRGHGGAYLVLVLLACGLTEIAIRRQSSPRSSSSARAVIPVVVVHSVAVGGLGALAWVAFKVGALSYGGGFVIVPLMQHDAVVTYHWMTASQFLNAVALGQITPAGRPDGGRRGLRGRGHRLTSIDFLGKKGEKEAASSRDLLR